MPRRLVSTLVAAAAALALGTVAEPASAARVRVMEWTITGSWSCGSGCGDGTALLQGSSTTCVQNGVDAGTAPPNHIAAAYPCSATLRGYPEGACVAGVCAITCCGLDVRITDPTAGTVLAFGPQIAGVIAQGGTTAASAVHLRSSDLFTSPTESWQLQGVIGNAASCAPCVGVNTFVLTLTQFRIET